MIRYVPDQVLELPVRPEASNLEYDDAVVIQQLIELAQESTIAANANMLTLEESVKLHASVLDESHLCHLKSDDLSIFTLLVRNISVIAT